MSSSLERPVKTANRKHVLKAGGGLPFSNWQVEEKNNRIQEILLDLGSDETFFRPKWLDVEQPEEVFNVSGRPTSLERGGLCTLQFAYHNEKHQNPSCKQLMYPRTSDLSMHVP